MKHGIVTRYSENPILPKVEIAAVLGHRDECTMVIRSHLRMGRAIFGLARSLD